MKKIHALIVDSDVEARKVLIQAIRKTSLADFAFIEADDGVEALVKFDAERVDAIFTDMNLPRMTGVEFTAELRNHRKQLGPVILLTDENRMEIIRKAVEEIRPQAVLLKPVDGQRLHKCVQGLVDLMPDETGGGVRNGEVVPQAAREIFASTCGLDLSSAPGESFPDGEVVFGMINLIGDLHWTVVLGFDRQAACEIAQQSAGFDIECDSEDMGDCIGELTNIFAGQVKALLTNRGLAVEISLPTVMSAKEIRIRVQRSTRVNHTYFESGKGRVWTGLSVGMNVGLVM